MHSSTAKVERLEDFAVDHPVKIQLVVGVELSDREVFECVTMPFHKWLKVVIVERTGVIVVKDQGGQLGENKGG